MSVFSKGFRRAALVLAIVSLPGMPVLAEDEKAEAEQAAPPVTIVRDGGVADTYRKEGAGFNAYGPDASQPAKPSEPVEERALRGLATADDIELVALQAKADTVPDLSCGSVCVGGFPVAGRTPVKGVHELTFIRETVADWMLEKGVADASCVPAFRHAVKFSSDSYRYEVLLAYNCGHYRILRGGRPVAEGVAKDPPGLSGVEAQLKAAGIAHFAA